MLSATVLAAQVGRNVVAPWQWWLTLGVGVAFLCGLVGFSYGTRAGIIARAATKEAVRQPIFALLLALSLVLLLLNTILPFFSLGEDTKMLKDCGLATMLISGMLLAVWTASTGIAEEIEGKTAMTLLSKPINRRQFIIGKYVGILQAILFLMIPLAICLLALIYFKVNYDARESNKEALEGITSLEDLRLFLRGLFSSNPEPTFQRFPRVADTVQVIPGIVLIFLEAAVLAAVSVAIATRLPMVVNLVTCAAIFVVGHLTPVLVLSTTSDRLEFVKFTAQLVATILPNLEVFNISAAVATGSMVPPAYLATALLYCLAYSTAAILLAFILFEDRDLA